MSEEDDKNKKGSRLVRDFNKLCIKLKFLAIYKWVYLSHLIVNSSLFLETNQNISIHTHQQNKCLLL